MKKLPYGISDYERIVEQDYYYVDKTMYIEKMENLPQPYIMFLRPRKFGKTLFTSVLENYYDLLKKDKFEKLYGETYIGKNPTKLRNTYHILRFNFSGIDTTTGETTINGFKEKTAISIDSFAKKYGIDFFVNNEQTSEAMLKSIFEAFKFQKPGEKIYVIIDEYDHFANELLGFNTDQFKTLVSKNGKVRKWYEILKEGTESVVDRIFITGVAPITLDSLTSGFNMSSDKTKDRSLNEMLGFTNAELIKLMEEQGFTNKEQEDLIPIMKENYDGYKFSIDGKEKIYNSNMCLYFLNEYIQYKEIPHQLIDVNIASDYAKLGRMLDLCKGNDRAEIILKTVNDELITSQIIEKFNPAMQFNEKDLVSMLYYLGYLTIEGEEFGIPKLKIPNRVMKEIYANYFIEILSKETDFIVDQETYTTITREIALEGKIDKIVEVMQTYLTNLSNRDYQRFDEKYIKLIFFCIAMNINVYRIKSEAEIQRKYPDILLIPRETGKGYASVMIEFKYLKKGEETLLQAKQTEAKAQIEEYAGFDEIKNIEKLSKYTVIAVNDKIYVEKI